MRSQLTGFFRSQLSAANSAQPKMDVRTSVSIWDGIARVYGCVACIAGELLEFADGSFGLALNLETQIVGAVRFASSLGEEVYPGDTGITAIGAMIPLAVASESSSSETDRPANDYYRGCNSEPHDSRMSLYRHRLEELNGGGNTRSDGRYRCPECSSRSFDYP